MQLLAFYFIRMQIFCGRCHSKRNIAPRSSETLLHSQVFDGRTTILVSFIAIAHCFDRRGNSDFTQDRAIYLQISKSSRKLYYPPDIQLLVERASPPTAAASVSRASLRSSYCWRTNWIAMYMNVQ